MKIDDFDRNNRYNEVISGFGQNLESGWFDIAIFILRIRRQEC